MSVIKEVPYRGLDPVSNTMFLAVMDENNNNIITIFGSNGECSSIRMTEKMKGTHCLRVYELMDCPCSVARTVARTSLASANINSSKTCFRSSLFVHF